MSLKKLKVSFTYHEIYIQIAVESYHKAKNLEAERIRKRNEKENMNDEDVDFQCEMSAKIDKCSIIAIIFSALTIEAFINDYGISNLSKSYFEKYLDKLDLFAKWIVIPKLVTGKQLDQSLNIFERLGKLISRRNNLVHYKTRKKLVENVEASDWIELKEAYDSIYTAKGLILTLKTVDQNVSSEWIDWLKL